MGVGGRTFSGVVCAVSVLLAFAWSYAPTGASLWRLWRDEPDYSHGFFVVPLALSFLWYRRREMPAMQPRWSWVAAGLLAAPIAMRALGARWNFAPLEYWSLFPWLCGIAWLCGGSAALRWCWPSILIVLFMMPLPFRAEQSLSYPLQTIATRASCWTLQALGQCALAEGHTILLGDHRLEIEQACSGLRMMLGAWVMGFAYAVFSRRRWWERVLIVASTIPVAIAANVGRIVVTGLVQTLLPGTWLANISHDGGGYLMIVLAVVLFQLIHWYLAALVYPLPEDAEAMAKTAAAPLPAAS